MKDVDLGQVSLGAVLNAEALKTTPDFQNGRNLGLQAQEPPPNLNIITVLSILRTLDAPISKLLTGARQPVEDLVQERVAFREGYLNGFREFLEGHGISSKDVLFFDSPDVIKTSAGLTGFTRGLRRESPAEARDYESARKGDKLLYNKLPEPDWVARARFERGQKLAGYRLGFVAGIARDMNVKLGGLDIPSDDLAYQEFMAGLRAEPRAVAVKPPAEKYSTKSEPFSVFEAIDERSYTAGLRLWLQSQGLGSLQSWQIRHPEALRAFKAGLNGETLSEYELPKPPAIVAAEPRRKELINLIDKFDRPLSSYEISRMECGRGYGLGKTLRAQKQVASASTSGS